MAMNPVRVKEVRDAATKLRRAVQSADEILATEMQKTFAAEPKSYRNFYEDLHAAVVATCEELGRKDLTAKIPPKVTEATAEKYWLATEVLIEFVLTNFPEGQPVAEPKAADKNPPPISLSDDEKRYQLCRHIVSMLRRLNKMADPTAVDLEISIGSFSAKTIKQAKNLLLDDRQLSTQQLTALSEQVRKKVEEYAPRPDQQLVTRFFHLRNGFAVLADGKDQLKDAVPPQMWEIKDAAEARRVTTSHQLIDWCKIMQQKKKELQTVPVAVNKESSKKDEPVVVVDPRKVQKAAKTNATFKPPAADLAAGNGEEFKQEPAEIEVIPQEPTPKEPETTDKTDKKEKEVSTEKPEPKPIPQRQQFAVLLKQRELILLDAKHLLVTDWLVTAEDIKFFGKVFRTSVDVEERIALLDEAIAKIQQDSTPKDGAPKDQPTATAKEAVKPSGLVTPATMEVYLTLQETLRTLDPKHEALDWPMPNPEQALEATVHARCERLRKIIGELQKSASEKREKPTERPSITTREKLIIGGALGLLTLMMVAVLIIAILFGASSNNADTTNQKPQISSELQEILDSIEE